MTLERTIEELNNNMAEDEYSYYLPDGDGPLSDAKVKVTLSKNIDQIVPIVKKLISYFID
jgi:hypothetical protein